MSIKEQIVELEGLYHNFLKDRGDLQVIDFDSFPATNYIEISDNCYIRAVKNKVPLFNFEQKMIDSLSKSDWQRRKILFFYTTKEALISRHHHPHEEEVRIIEGEFLDKETNIVYKSKVTFRAYQPHYPHMLGPTKMIVLI